LATFVLAILAPTAAGAYGDTARRTRTAPQYWIAVAGTISAIEGEDRSIAHAVFGSAHTIALGSGPGSIAISWASYTKFAADLEAGRIASTVRAVMYDPEAWDATPLPEQQDPVHYIEKFVQLAHLHGYFAIVTPHPGLVSVKAAACEQRDGETQEAAYVRCRIAEGAARYADAYETQAQILERNPGAYRAFVLATALQARKANPDVVVLSGLSTAPGYPAPSLVLYSAWNSVRDIVDGHYLSLAGPDRTTARASAASFLRLIAAPGR
jgi:hypothetical protein